MKPCFSPKLYQGGSDLHPQGSVIELAQDQPHGEGHRHADQRHDCAAPQQFELEAEIEKLRPDRGEHEIARPQPHNGGQDSAYRYARTREIECGFLHAPPG
ncbi:MAG: hypothetical protein B7Y88_15400 [Sphingomonadales bacterium 32-64-17]|nr:MAG: hypothetical protein B7Y88_15400 [Sphingomonadales bacterium 32-64-17]